MLKLHLAYNNKSICVIQIFDGTYTIIFHFIHYFCWNRVIEMPYAYQCCVFGACNGYKAASQWEEQMGSEEEDLQKKALSQFPIHTDNNCKSYNLTRPSHKSV